VRALLEKLTIPGFNEQKTAAPSLRSDGALRLRILHLEDEPRDSELIQETLETEGIACAVTRVDTQTAFREFLERGNFDLILVDYSLPSFDGMSALKMAREVLPEVPFIFVSGTLGDERGVEALKMGATDYVFKSRLSKIVPSVSRALREAQERSHRQRTEQTLRESEAYLAEAQRLSQTGSWAWKPETGDIRYWSEECYRMLGFDPQGPLPSFEEFMPRVHSGDRTHVRQRFEKAVREKADFEMEYRLVHPSKGIRDIHAVGRAILGRSGELTEFVGTVIDVTERKRAEEELRQLVDFMPQVVLVLDPDGRFIHVNRVAREYTGMTLEEFRSAGTVTKAVHPDDVDEVRALRQRALSEHVQFEHEGRLLGKDGVYRWFLFRFTPLIKHGSVIRWLGTATEIESRKQEEERVRKENVRLEERTRIAQELHDTLLQTFLSASMQLSIAVDGVPPESPVKPRLDRVLGIMKQGIEEGRHTIEDLRCTDFQPFDLVAALSSIQQELGVSSNVDFRVSVAGSERPLQPLIRHEIHRIGREALINAFAHSKANRVEFKVEYAGSDFRMRICDSGCGIGPDVLRDGRDGHWGLAGMRERARRIGGILKISSSPATGTEVQLSVPAALAFHAANSD
jgi:PAS domain S-box-containing protein